MEVIIYKCDQCNKQIEQDDFDNSKWIMIESIHGGARIHAGEFYKDFDNRDIHFCSIACLTKLIKEIK